MFPFLNGEVIYMHLTYEPRGVEFGPIRLIKLMHHLVKMADRIKLINVPASKLSYYMIYR